MVKEIIFVINWKFYYLESKTTIVEGLTAQKLNRFKAKVSYLSMQTKMFRFMLYKYLFMLLSIFLIFLSFMLILPTYIHYGKAEGLFCMSAWVFFTLLLFGWNSMSPISRRITHKKQLIEIFSAYVLKN